MSLDWRRALGLPLLFTLLLLQSAFQEARADFQIMVDGKGGELHWKPVSSTVTLLCTSPTIGGLTLSSITWFNPANNHVSRLRDPDLQLSSTRDSLTISRLHTRHKGRWACQGTMCVNQSEPSASCTKASVQGFTILRVLEPPAAEIREPEHKVIAGQRLEIHCRIGGASPLKVSFFLNDTLLATGFSGSYAKMAASSEDQGIFRCVNHNSDLNMSATSTTKVIVYEPPVVEMTPRVVKVYSGTTVRLECKVVRLDRDVRPVTVQIRRGTLPKCFQGQQLARGALSSGSLLSKGMNFSAIAMHDAGEYYCQATTPRLQGCINAVSQQTVKVDVVDQPPQSQISTVHREASVVRIAGIPTRPGGVNREVTLTCSAKDAKPDLALQRLWYHDGKLLRSSHGKGYGFAHGNTSLNFISFLPEMSGDYSCSVNYAGFPEVNVTRTNSIRVFIREPPKTQISAEKSDFEVGEMFTATCFMSVGNGVKRFVEWRRRVSNVSFPIPFQARNATAAELTLANLNLRDSGEYMCVGTDPEIDHLHLRSSSASVQLRVRPTGLAGVNVQDGNGGTPTMNSPPDETVGPVTSDSEEDLAAGLGAGSAITDDRLYVTVAIVGSVIALLFAVFIFILLGYVHRRRAWKVAALDKESEKAKAEQSPGEDGSNGGVPRPTKLTLVTMTENDQYETVVVAPTSSGEKRKDSIRTSHDDGIADCSQVGDTDMDTGSGAGISLKSTGRTRFASSYSKASLDTEAGHGGDGTPQKPAAESDVYSEPFDPNSRVRTSIRSFASAMKEEGSRAQQQQRGVILRKVQKAASADGDTYSLPRDATIQVIDPDSDADYSAPADVTRRHSVATAAVPADDYSLPLDGRSNSELLFVRSGTNKSSRPATRHSSIVSVRQNGYVGSLQSLGFDDVSRSPSPVDESLYAEPYAEPPANMDAIYSTLRRSQRFRDICADNIKIENELGSGRFGNVYRGVWTENASSRQVAVKTLKDGVDPHERLLFLQEAAIMGQFRHKNLVRLYGVVTQGDTLMLVEELMSSDNLRQYLLKHRPDDTGLPNEMQLGLVSMCKGIADGMNYLANRFFVHRDLAARNILLDSDNTCKIGDFGMSRGMESDHYESSGGVIPVKWSAPEAIEYRSFSSASDVWSYGVVLYEIWTFGKCPYSWWDNEQVMVKIKAGYRLPRPDHCPPALYNLMKDCWEEAKADRPTFQQILQRLDGPPEVLLRMPKALSVSKKKHVRAVFMPEGGDTSDSSCSGKADQS